jgi:hypothetical protein
MLLSGGNFKIIYIYRPLFEMEQLREEVFVEHCRFQSLVLYNWIAHKAAKILQRNWARSDVVMSGAFLISVVA